ncbi:hypothetical protein Acsp02_90680 [Actinoplanes sp. NBRC 103695]|nr:hypothetical protein Acsp02_90680 [Actinoplanes sp. NBRC 103695]
MVSRPTGMPSLRASLAPGRPAKATSIAINAFRNGGLYRECGVVRPGICSTNVTRAQSSWRQTKRRIRSWMTTGRPARAVSASCR